MNGRQDSINRFPIPRQILFPAALLLALTTIFGWSSASAQTLYSIGNPSNEQQYMLELINRARANGQAEALRLGLSGLQEGPPSINGEPWTIQNSVQPLSWNPLLQGAAQGQSNRLNNADQFFLGGSPHTFGGMTPEQRIAAAGYVTAPYMGPTTVSGFFPGNEDISEEVSQGSGPYVGSRLIAAVLNAHNGLFTDLTVPGRGHRNTTMLAFFREVGIGITTGRDNQMAPGQPNGQFDSIYVVQDFGRQSTSTPFVTGVVYHDANANNFYDPGEGIAGVRVDVSNTAFFAVTAASGGYSVPVNGNGSYTVTFSGGGVATVQRAATVMNALNVKLDYRAGVSTSTARGDFNGDTFSDYLLFNASTRRTAIWNLHGAAFLGGTFGPILPAGWTVACVADVNLDGKPDLVLFNASTRKTAIWFLNNGTLASSAFGPTIPAGWSLMATADFNNNSKPDYLLFNASTRQTAIWYLNGGTFLSSAFGPTLPVGWIVLDALDFNADNKPDFLLTKPSTRQTAIWYLNGAIRTSGLNGPTLSSGWTLQGAADFNSDSKPDYVLFEPGTRRTAQWYLSGGIRTGAAYGPTLPTGYVLVFP